MIFSDQRHELRQQFLSAWQKHKNQETLTPLEKMIVDIILLHPEYHAFLDQGEKVLEKDYLPEFGETNPFLHMSLHISIHEQLSTDRPNGIRALYQQAIMGCDRHDVEHIMMDCLAEILWDMQRSGQAADDQRYLHKLREALRKLQR